MTFSRFGKHLIVTISYYTIDISPTAIVINDCRFHHCTIIVTMTKKDFKLAIIVGTNRTNRQSMLVARLIEKAAQSFVGFEPQVVDLLQFHFSQDDQEPALSDPAYKQIIEEADALLIVLPEYNHGYPAALKRALDSEYAIYLHKPVALASVSSGPWGGVRAIESLLPVLRSFGLLISKVDLNFSNVRQLFDNDGNLLDLAYLPRIEKFLTELLWLTQISHWGQKNLNSAGLTKNQ